MKNDVGLNLVVPVVIIGLLVVPKTQVAVLALAILGIKWLIKK